MIAVRSACSRASSRHVAPLRTPPTLFFSGRIFCGKPVSTPDQVRGRLFPENAPTEQAAQPLASDDIPFDKRFDLPPDTVEEVVPGVRRLLANNPSPFTFKGTLSYIVGRGQVAIIDPGPLDEAHISSLLDAVS